MRACISRAAARSAVPPAVCRRGSAHRRVGRPRAVDVRTAAMRLRLIRPRMSSMAVTACSRLSSARAFTIFVVALARNRYVLRFPAWCCGRTLPVVPVAKARQGHSRHECDADEGRGGWLAAHPFQLVPSRYGALRLVSRQNRRHVVRQFLRHSHSVYAFFLQTFQADCFQVTRHTCLKTAPGATGSSCTPVGASRATTRHETAAGRQ